MGNQLMCGPNGAIESHVRNSQIQKAAKNFEKQMEEKLLQQHLMFLLQQQQHQQQQNGSMGTIRPDQFMHFLQAQQKGIIPRSIGSPHKSTTQSADSDVKSNSATRINHFVLVHGGGTGAWCWYKCIALLEEAGFVATAIDLAGSGADSTDPNKIAGLDQYTQPLLQFLEDLPEEEKVVLVTHDFGGASISYAMEKFSHKIAKAVFIAATMVVSGQSAFDVFASEALYTDKLLLQFLYENGNSSSPTAIKFDKSLVKSFFFNQCPAKDVALATVSMRPIPFAPLVEKLNLTPENYGKVSRFFIQTTADLALSPSLQERLIAQNPPEKLFKLKSDHCPFLSKPQSLHKIFTEIAN